MASIRTCDPHTRGVRLPDRGAPADHRRVVRRMQARREAAEQRSAHLFYLLRGLWAQLCVLRNVSASGPGAVARQSDHIREICSEMRGALDSDAGVANRRYTG